jgi:hypothetical protein
VPYETETTPAISGTINVVNNFEGTDDTVTVPGVEIGDTVTVTRGGPDRTAG